jgi:hypothetical protein
MQTITRQILNQVSRVIVLSQHSRVNLLKIYDIKADIIRFIPHGIHPVPFIYPEEAKTYKNLTDKMILGTFGFLSPGKGIEYVIRALPEIIKKFPDTEYWLMGKTHPLGLLESGESYRQSLEQMVDELGLKKHVRFYNKYLALEEIQDFLEVTDIYVCTSLNPEQTVSGTLSYALGSGRCLVSTRFAQALEYIKPGMGLLVDFNNPRAYASAITGLLKNPEHRIKIQNRVYQKTRNMLWGNVGLDYGEVYGKAISEDLPLPEIKLDHLFKMTGKYGLVQFAKGSRPDLSSGYTLDDNARGVIVASQIWRLNKDPRMILLMHKYLDLISRCQQPSGQFINYISPDGSLEEKLNTSENLEDANSRAVWALGTLINDFTLPRDIRTQAGIIWEKWYKSGYTFSHLRSKAFMIKGLMAAGSLGPEIPALADDLLEAYRKNKTAAWHWFEPQVTYANGVLPEALLLAYQATGLTKYLTTGKAALEFLIKNNYREGIYLPVGQAGWLVKDHARADFDQQPEEPAAMIMALKAAQKSTSDNHYGYIAERIFYWYLGNNLLCRSVYDRSNGGVFDGLKKTGLNINQGAESLLSYLLARLSFI